MLLLWMLWPSPTLAYRPFVSLTPTARQAMAPPPKVPFFSAFFGIAWDAGVRFGLSREAPDAAFTLGLTFKL